MDYYKKYLAFDTDKKLKDYRTKGDKYWKTVGEKMALQLFKEAATRVPAYKKFLQKNKISASKVKTLQDFQKVPITDKDSYINKYKINELCWDGKIESSYFLSASSGSTGIPNFWPRSTEQTYQGATISELIYKEYFNADKKSTLYIVAFAMGMWIAGTYMAMSTEWVAQKGYPITVATPGLNREEIIRLVRMGSKYYDQIILVGYPPFVKDVLDFGVLQGVNWKKINIKFIFSGEAFTERWREHIGKITNLRNTFINTINIYGSADVGLVAHETPFTNYLRKIAAGNPTINNELFGESRTPSVNQYDPEIRYFENNAEKLIVTAPSGIPLIRYNTKDEGGILYFDEALEITNNNGVNMFPKFNKMKMEKTIWRTPIVYLFGRGKFTATIYGVSIFPEYTKYILDNPKLIGLVTGKYVISTEENTSQDQELHFRVEIKEHGIISEVVEDLIRAVFVSELPKISSEYNHLQSSLGVKVHPIIHLHEYGDPQFFPRGIIKKNA